MTLNGHISRTHVLSICTHAPADSVKVFAESLLDALGEISVISNRTGLVMLPYTDPAQGTRFHLGEVLIAEAHVRIASGEEGYASCIGRDLVQAIALAVIDAALAANVQSDSIHAFAHTQHAAQIAQDDALLKQIEATRIEMETF
jgi:alpha-D-ribose 1-methylphosphonate 5-triphosphate synthase subunit PhnG